jgi:phosphopantetheinyl transferase
VEQLMPLLFQHTDPCWGVWKIEESADDLLFLLERKDAYRDALAEKRTEKRKQEWLAARVLLKELLGEEALIGYRPNGAPYLPEKNMHISISHTNGYAAVSLNPDSPAGIDIEYRSDRILKVRSRFMSEEEDAAVDPEHEADHLLVYWCVKEALFKRVGQSDIDFREHLHVAPFPYSESGRLIATETRTPQAAAYWLDYYINKSFAIGLLRDMVETN